MKKDTLPPCAADALWQVRQVTIGCRSVGIMKLDECIAAVRAEDLSSDEEILGALLKAVRTCNYIPPPFEAEYASVLLGEYRKAFGKRPLERTPS